MQTLGWLDTLLLGVIVVSALVGLWRGVVYEVLSLAGWLIAWLTAQAWGPSMALAWLPAGWSTALKSLAGYAVLFVGTLIIWRLLVWLLQQMLHASPVAPIDRALGAVFGVVRGAVILLAAVTLIGMTPLALNPSWLQSAGVQWAQWSLAVLAPILPGGTWIERMAPPSGAAQT